MRDRVTRGLRFGALDADHEGADAVAVAVCLTDLLRVGQDGLEVVADLDP